MRLWYLPFYMITFFWLKNRARRIYKKAKRKNKVAESESRYRIAYILSKRTLFLMKVKVVYHNKDIVSSTKNYLITPNHQSNFDALFLVAGFKKYVMAFVAKEELLKDFRVNSFLKILYTFPLPRNNLRENLKIMDKVREFMVINKKSVLIFPEGKRSKQQEMDEFKPGAFKLAFQTHCQILPVTIKNSYKINANIFRKKIIVDVFFHKPIPPMSFINSDTTNLAKRVHEIINSKLV